MDKPKILRLLDQIIEKSVEEDDDRKREDIAKGDLSKLDGESWMTFHLKSLKQLIENS
tara:strand:+ start:432 stop:605 length:174 start_codon:yes stop_codon:yes gene_type:complete